MSGTPYLEGLPKRPLRGMRAKYRVVLLWALLVGMFLAIWQLLAPVKDADPRPRPPRAPIEDPSAPAQHALEALGAFALVAGILYLRVRKGLFVPPDPLLDAEMALSTGDLEGAVAKGRAAVAVAGTQVSRAQGMFLLARVAIVRAHFSDAAEVLDVARGELAGITGPYRNQMGAYYGAHRGFALAALGRLDEAQAEIVKSARPDAYPGTLPVAALARAVVLARQDDNQALLRHVSEVSRLVRRALTLRERVLFRTLALHAKSKLEPATRTAGHDASLDPEMRGWIAAIAPSVAAGMDAR